MYNINRLPHLIAPTHRHAFMPTSLYNNAANKPIFIASYINFIN